MKSPDGRECSTFLQHRKVALTGKRTSTLYLLNPEERRVEQVEVDNCAINQEPRCDWLVRLDDAISREEIYVELKGVDIRRAVVQLAATISQLSTDCLHVPKRRIVVFTRNPMTGTDVQNFKVRFFREFGARFHLVRNNAEVAL
jgi:hypothetical protein